MNVQGWWHCNPGKMENWDGPLISRANLLMHVMTVVETTTSSMPGVSIALRYFSPRNNKGWWDGEPQRILDGIQTICPSFWDSYPGKAETVAQRKGIMSKQAASWLDAGAPRHQKPNLRKKAELPVWLTAR